MFIAKKQAVFFGSFKTYPCGKVCSACFDCAQRRSVSRPSLKQLQLRNVCPLHRCGVWVLEAQFLRGGDARNILHVCICYPTNSCVIIYNGDYPKIRCLGTTLCMMVVCDVRQPTTSIFNQDPPTHSTSQPWHHVGDILRGTTYAEKLLLADPEVHLGLTFEVGDCSSLSFLRWKVDVESLLWTHAPNFLDLFLSLTLGYLG